MAHKPRPQCRKGGRPFAPKIREDIAHKDMVTASFAITDWVCYIIAALLLSWVVGALVHNDVIARSVADRVAFAPAAWPSEERRKAYERAKAYNASLERTLAGRIPAAARDTDGATLEQHDTAYMTTLNVDAQGAMASLQIPQISVNIPIYHTTLDASLDDGAGHIYGTALPIGEDHSYSALGAHSGGVQGLLFTRLNELRENGVFYIDVLGGEHGYRVKDIRTIKPEDMERTLRQLRDRYERGPATVTLITCTPIGVNTDRLLVTGVREPIPSKIAPASSQHDVRLITVLVGAAVLLLLIVAAIVFRVIRAKRHASAQATP